MIRYNYGNLMADTTPEERKQIIESYKTGRHRRDPEAGKRSSEENGKEDLRGIREKHRIPEEKPGFHPPKK